MPTILRTVPRECYAPAFSLCYKGLASPKACHFAVAAAPSELRMGGRAPVAQSTAINNYALGLALRVGSLNANLRFNVFLPETA